MKKITKALAAIMLITAVSFTVSCNNSSNNNGGEVETDKKENSVPQKVVKEHEYVDLGLPSGTMWATCNVGADTPEGSGDSFAWGETMPKTNFEWSNYKYCLGDSERLTKYCEGQTYRILEYESPSIYETFTTLHSCDDAATSNWGGEWCMPTKEQWEELLRNTTATRTSQNGVEGFLFTANNGEILFLPDGHYWSKSISSFPVAAWELWCDQRGVNVDYAGREGGDAVRAVRLQQAFNGDEYVDLGLPSGTLWATCNVGGITPEDYGDYFIDASTANLGGDWCVPTEEQWVELNENTTNTWTARNGIAGRLFTAENGNTLFLPAAGCHPEDICPQGAGRRGLFWLNMLAKEPVDNSGDAWIMAFTFNHDYMTPMSYDRSFGGCSIRAVRSLK